MKKRTTIVAIQFLIVGSLAAALAVQDVDPFYASILQKAEQTFVSGDYAKAIKELEIAYFGIHEDKRLKAKACIYLGLCCYYLRNTERGIRYLREAEELLSKEELLTLDVAEAARFDLGRLMYAHESGTTVKPEGLTTLPPVPQERAVLKAKTDRKQIEREIRVNPKDISLYYELYSFHRDKNEFKEAVKAIEDLIKKNPREIFAYYLLGILRYQARKFKDSTANFERFFKLAESLDPRSELQAEARAYQILNIYFDGDRDGALRLTSQSQTLLSLDTIWSLPLSNKDKIILRGLLENRKK